MLLADTFIQNDFQCIQSVGLIMCSLESKPMTLVLEQEIKLQKV